MTPRLQRGQVKACLRALTTACAQITTLKGQLNAVATTKLKRGLNEALAAKNEEITDLRKLVEAHKAGLALTGKNKEIAELKRVIRAQGEELTEFYKRARDTCGRPKHTSSITADDITYFHDSRPTSGLSGVQAGRIGSWYTSRTMRSTQPVSRSYPVEGRRLKRATAAPRQDKL